MKAKLLQLKIFSVLMLILIGYNQCGNPYNLETTELEYKETPLAGSLSSDESLETFRTSVYTITSQYCVGCHTTQSPTHAHPDVKRAHDSLISLFKVNFQNPANSRIVAKIRDENHSCWGSCADNANEMLAQVEVWAQKVNELEEEEDEQQTTGTNGGNTNGATTGATTGSTALSSVDAFEQSVYPITSQRCFPCHQNISPRHANPNIQIAHDDIINQAKVNFNNIPASRLVQRLSADNHNCWGNCQDNANEMEAAISQWQDLTQETGGYTATGIVSPQSDFVANIFGGDTVLPPGTVSMDFELNQLLGIQESVIFRINIREFDEFSYQVNAPQIISTRTIRVSDIKLLLNGYYNPQHSTYTFVDKVVTPQDSSVSNYAMIVLKDQGNNLDRISFEFGTLQIMN